MIKTENSNPNLFVLTLENLQDTIGLHYPGAYIIDPCHPVVWTAEEKLRHAGHQFIDDVFMSLQTSGEMNISFNTAKFLIQDLIERNLMPRGTYIILPDNYEKNNFF